MILACFRCLVAFIILFFIASGWNLLQIFTSLEPLLLDSTEIAFTDVQTRIIENTTTRAPTKALPTEEVQPLSYLEIERQTLEKLREEVEEVKRCVQTKRGKRKCFKFKGEEIFAKEPYKEKDMIMKYPNQYHVILNNPYACMNDPYILIGTPVGPRQVEERVATRLSWGKVKEVNGMIVKHLFFAGQDENDPEGDRLLREENDYYRDIIQFDMKNHFMNLTLLSILTYNWTSHYCPGIKYYVRCDNDMWMNPTLFISRMLSTPRNNSILGYRILSGQPIRHPQSRYYLPHKIYAEKSFPPYMSGCFLAISGDALKGIVETSATIRPILYFDDVFLGFVARERKLQFVPFPVRKMFFQPVDFNVHFKKAWGIHRIRPAVRIAIWELLRL